MRRGSGRNSHAILGDAPHLTHYRAYTGVWMWKVRSQKTSIRVWSSNITFFTTYVLHPFVSSCLGDQSRSASACCMKPPSSMQGIVGDDTGQWQRMQNVHVRPRCTITSWWWKEFWDYIMWISSLFELRASVCCFHLTLDNSLLIYNIRNRSVHVSPAYPLEQDAEMLSWRQYSIRCLCFRACYNRWCLKCCQNVVTKLVTICNSYVDAGNRRRPTSTWVISTEHWGDSEISTKKGGSVTKFQRVNQGKLNSLLSRWCISAKFKRKWTPIKDCLGARLGLIP